MINDKLLQTAVPQPETKTDLKGNNSTVSIPGYIKQAGQLSETTHKTTADASRIRENPTPASNIRTLITHHTSNKNKQLTSITNPEKQMITSEDKATDSHFKEHAKKPKKGIKQRVQNLKDNVTKTAIKTACQIKNTVYQPVAKDNQTSSDQSPIKNTLTISTPLATLATLATGIALPIYDNSTDKYKNVTLSLKASSEHLDTTNREQISQQDHTNNVDSAHGPTDHNEKSQSTSLSAFPKALNKESDTTSSGNIDEKNTRRSQSISSHNSSSSIYEEEEEYFEALEDISDDKNSSTETTNKTAEDLQTPDTIDNTNSTEKTHPEPTDWSCSRSLNAAPRIPVFDEQSKLYVEEIRLKIQTQAPNSKAPYALYCLQLSDKKWSLNATHNEYGASGIIYDDKGFSRIEFTANSLLEGHSFNINTISPENSSKKV